MNNPSKRVRARLGSHRDGWKMEVARQFVALFPEAQAYHISVLTPEKRVVVHRPSIATAAFLKNLDAWLRLEGVHVFCRPLLRTLVFLDLDGFQKNWQTLLQL